MFKQEMFGYSKEDVNNYLVETLKRLDSFEHTIEVQREEIKSLEIHGRFWDDEITNPKVLNK